jgi:hypothetical protein
MPPILEHEDSFEILTKHKKAIRQLVNYAAILIPKLMLRYNLGYSTILKILYYEALERAWPTQTRRPRLLNDAQIR